MPYVNGKFIPFEQFKKQRSQSFDFGKSADNYIKSTESSSGSLGAKLSSNIDKLRSDIANAQGHVGSAPHNYKAPSYQSVLNAHSANQFTPKTTITPPHYSGTSGGLNLKPMGALSDPGISKEHAPKGYKAPSYSNVLKNHHTQSLKDQAAFKSDNKPKTSGGIHPLKWLDNFNHFMLHASAGFESGATGGILPRMIDAQSLMDKGKINASQAFSYAFGGKDYKKVEQLAKSDSHSATNLAEHPQTTLEKAGNIAGNAASFLGGGESLATGLAKSGMKQAIKDNALRMAGLKVSQHALPKASNYAKISLSEAEKVGKAIAHGAAYKVGSDAVKGATSPDATDSFTGKEDLANDFGKSFRAGMGDLQTNAGQIAEWVGHQKTGENLIKQGTQLSDQYLKQKPVTWKDYANPKFYVESFGRNLPNSIALMPLALGGGAVGAGVGSLAKMGTFGRSILAAIGGSALPSAVESAMEAGQTYDQVKKAGKSNKVASKAANSVFYKNLALLGASNALEFGMNFTGLEHSILGRVGSQAGKLATKMGISAATEGTQEILQNKFQSDAQGQKFNLLDPSNVQAGMIGAAFGAGFSAVGHFTDPYSLIDNIHNEVYQKLTPEQQAEHDQLAQQYKDQGLNDQQAKDKAMGDLADKNPEVKQMTMEATKNVVEQVKNEYDQMPPEQQAQISGESQNPDVTPQAQEKPYAADLTQQDQIPSQESKLEPQAQEEPPKVSEKPKKVGTDYQIGDKVSLKGRSGHYEVVDNSDTSSIKLKNEHGTELTVGRAAVSPVEGGTQEVTKQEQPKAQETPERQLTPREMIDKNGYIDYKNPSDIEHMRKNQPDWTEQKQSDGSVRFYPPGSEALKQEQPKSEEKPVEQSNVEQGKQETTNPENANVAPFGKDTPLKYESLSTQDVKDVLDHLNNNNKGIEKANESSNHARTVLGAIDLFRSGKTDALLKNDSYNFILKNAGNNPYYAKTFEHFTGVKLPHSADTKAQESSLRETLQSAYDNYKSGNQETNAPQEVHPEEKQIVSKKEIAAIKKPSNLEDYTKSFDKISKAYENNVIKQNEMNHHIKRITSVDMLPDNLKNNQEAKDLIDEINTSKGLDRKRIAVQKLNTLKDHIEKNIKPSTESNLDGTKSEHNDVNADETQSTEEEAKQKEASNKEGNKQDSTELNNKQQDLIEKPPLKIIDNGFPLTKVDYSDTKTRVKATFTPQQRWWDKEAPKPIEWIFPKDPKGFLRLPKGVSVADVNDKLNIEFFQEGVTSDELTKTFDYLNQHFDGVKKPERNGILKDVAEPSKKDAEQFLKDHVEIVHVGDNKKAPENTFKSPKINESDPETVAVATKTARAAYYISRQLYESTGFRNDLRQNPNQNVPDLAIKYKGEVNKLIGKAMNDLVDLPGDHKDAINAFDKVMGDQGRILILDTAKRRYEKFGYDMGVEEQAKEEPKQEEKQPDTPKIEEPKQEPKQETQKQQDNTPEPQNNNVPLSFEGEPISIKETKDTRDDRKMWVVSFDNSLGDKWKDINTKFYSKFKKRYSRYTKGYNFYEDPTNLFKEGDNSGLLSTTGDRPNEEEQAKNVPGTSEQGSAKPGNTSDVGSVSQSGRIDGGNNSSEGSANGQHESGTALESPVHDSTGSNQDEHGHVDSSNGEGRTGVGNYNETVSRPRGNVAADFKLTNELDDLGGTKTKFKNNIAALELIHALTNEGRLATPEEQAVLAKYVGWGGLANAFNEDSAQWKNEYAKLKSLVDNGVISQDEYESARRTTRYAHYTAKEVVNTMYDALNNFGFKGGRVLEPAMGVGNFFGFMPENMTYLSNRHGVEFDSLTGRIAKQIYQNANIQIKPFQDYQAPDGFFDVVVGNPPFASDTHNYKGDKLSLHNYFFVKSLDKLRPGGILAFVTSTGTLNAPTARNARELMGEKANFLGAIRLNDEAFKKNAGTQVTTDIIFFQKRAEGEPENHAGNFLDTQKMTIDGETVDNNNYFIERPYMVLGEYSLSSLQSGPRLAVKSDGRDMKQALQEAIDRLPKNIYQKAESLIAAPKDLETIHDFANPENLDEGAFAYHKGMIVQKTFGNIVKADVKPGDVERIKAFVELRDFVRQFLRDQRDGMTDDELKAAQKILNKMYDTAVKKFGYINSDANKRVLRPDVLGSSLLRSLEKINKEGRKITSVQKTDIFTKRTIQQKPNITNAETSHDALVYSLFTNGKIDLEYMSRLSGKPEEDILKELEGEVFHNPANNTWETKDAYLSGNVRQKLKDAQAFAETDGRYSINVEALKTVQPEDLLADEIFVQLGSPWIPPQDVEDFIHELTGTNEAVSVGYQSALGKWTIGRKNTSALYRSSINTEELGVKPQLARDKDAVTLIEDLLNMKQTNFTYKDSFGQTHTDQEAFDVGISKKREIQERFQEWIWSHPDRTERLTEKYNWEYNNTRLPEYDGTIVYGKGKEDNRQPDRLNPRYTLRPWQKNVIWRILQGKNTLVAHTVGAGKTLEMIVSGMEMRRLGLAKKPMYVVPNHLLDQWNSEFREAYPDAKILRLSNSDIPSIGVAKGEVQEDITPGETLKEGTKVKVVNDVTNWRVEQHHGDKVYLVYQPSNKKKSAKRKTVTIDQILYKKREQTEEEYQQRRTDRQIERATALNKIAVGDHDAVIITHQTFGKLPMSPGAMQEYIREQLEDLEMAIREAAAENDKDPSIKDLEKAKERLENKLKENIDEEAKDIAIPFEELGIDHIFVDESHEFKNLSFHTKMSRISGLSNTSSKKAEDMYMKTRWLTRMRNGGGITFATGTPISNTLAELYSLMKYLTYDQLKNLGLTHFDSWAAQFAQTSTGTEMTAAGTFKTKTRFNSFNNLPELMQMFMGFTDIKVPYHGEGEAPPNHISLDVPKNVKRHNVVANISPDQERYYQDLMERAQAVDSRSVQPDEDNWLKITGDGRKAALDMRLQDPEAEDFPGSKVNLAAENIFKVWKEGTKQRKDKDGKPIDNLAQLVFLDLSTPKEQVVTEDDQQVEDQEDVQKFDVYNDLKKKLIKMGIPEKEIEFIHSANTDVKKQQLFDKVRNGKVRVLMGSSQKMGAGMNVQDRIVALHHLDAPWRPSDIEQREGRMIRQGNRLNDVHVYNYATEKTLDSLMWGILKNKAKFIGQVMSGNNNSRQIEDVGVQEARFAEIQAVTSGNDLFIRHRDAQKALMDIQNLKNSWLRNKKRYQSDLATLPKYIANTTKIIQEIKEDTKKITDMSGDNFKMKIGKKTFTERKDAGAAINEMYETQLGDVNYGEYVKIGEFSGFDVIFGKQMAGLTIGLRGKHIYNAAFNTGTITGNVTRLENGLKDGIKKNLANYERSLSDDEKRLEQVKELVDKPFKQEEQLKEKQREFDALNRELIGEQKPQEVNEDNIEEALNKNINRNNRSGAEMGIVPQGLLSRSRKRKTVYFPSSDPDVEQEIGNSLEPRKPSIYAKLSQQVKMRFAEATREFRHLPNGGRFAELRRALLHLKSQKSVSEWKTVKKIQGLVAGFSPQEYELFNRLVVTDDLMEEMSMGHALPFKYTPETLERDHKTYTDALQHFPDVKDALRNRQILWNAIKRDYIQNMKDIGFNVTDKFKREKYYRHIVIDMAEKAMLERYGLKGSAKELRTPSNSDYLRSRKGSDKNIVWDYLYAETDVMAHMIYDAEIAKAIKTVDKYYNIKDRVQKDVDRENADIHDSILKGMAKGHLDEKVKQTIREYYMTTLKEDPELFELVANKDESEAHPYLDYLETLQKRIRGRKGMAYGQLASLAKDGQLWTGDNGEFTHVVEDLARRANHEEFLKRDPKEDKFMTNEFFRYLSALIDSQEEGAVSAQIFLHNHMKQKNLYRDMLGDRMVKVEDRIPKGYVLWQPREGSVYYMGTTIDKETAKLMFENALEAIDLEKAKTQDVMIVGANRPAFIIPEEAANQLDEISISTNLPINALARKLTSIIKPSMLMAPTKFIKYNLRNMSGDIDRTLSGNMKAFKQVPRATRELVETFVRNRAMTPELMEWFSRGGYEASLTNQEYGDVKYLSMFKHLTEAKRGDVMSIVKTLKNVTWEKGIKGSTNLREAILRYSNYLEYLRQIEKNGGKPDNYGASNPYYINALHDYRDKAFQLANDLMIAYNRTSFMGQELRGSWFPFWSFTEGNFRSYIQIIRNAAYDDKTALDVGKKILGIAVLKTARYSLRTVIRLGKVAIMVSLFTALCSLYNYWRYPKAEKLLPDDVQRSVHIITGVDKNGTVHYFNRMGLLQDFLEWFNLDESGYYVAQMVDRQMTIGQVWEDMNKGSMFNRFIEKPLNKLANSTNPVFDAMYTGMSGKTTFPNVFDRKDAHQTIMETLLQPIGLSNEFNLIYNHLWKGKAVKPINPRDYIDYSTNEGQAAYYDIKALAQDYLTRVLGKGKGTAGNPDTSSTAYKKSQALYEMKLSLQYNDQHAFEVALQDYVANGGTDSGMKSSIEGLVPTGKMTATEVDQFAKTLTGTNKDKYKLAMDFYNNVLRGDPKIYQKADKDVGAKALPVDLFVLSQADKSGRTAIDTFKQTKSKADTLYKNYNAMFLNKKKPPVSPTQKQVDMIQYRPHMNAIQGFVSDVKKGADYAIAHTKDPQKKHAIKQQENYFNSYAYGYLQGKAPKQPSFITDDQVTALKQVLQAKIDNDVKLDNNHKSDGSALVAKWLQQYVK